MRRAETLRLIQTPGFQFVVEMLRTLEINAFNALRQGAAGNTTERALGQLQAVESIRQTVDQLLTEPLEWGNEQDEDWPLDEQPQGGV